MISIMLPLYVQPPYNFWEYSAGLAPQTDYSHYSPPDPMSFHSPKYFGYLPMDGSFYSPLEGQHQHNLVPVPSSYSPCYSPYTTYDEGLGHYENFPQLLAPPILPSSSFSELGHALVETLPPDSQPINHSSIAIPSLAMPPSFPKHELSETLVGLNAVKTEYASDVNGQPFSPITSSLSTLPLSPRPKEEGQDQVHVFPAAPGIPHGRLHHRSQHKHDSFRLVSDLAAYRGYTSAPPSKVCSPPALRFPCHLYLPRGSSVVRPSRYQDLLLILLARLSTLRFPLPSPRLISGRPLRASIWSTRAPRGRRRPRRNKDRRKRRHWRRTSRPGKAC